jgi:hypothetical protein
VGSIIKGTPLPQQPNDRPKDKVTLRRISLKICHKPQKGTHRDAGGAWHTSTEPFRLIFFAMFGRKWSRTLGQIEVWLLGSILHQSCISDCLYIIIIIIIILLIYLFILNLFHCGFFVFFNLKKIKNLCWFFFFNF